jgi:uncharacterized protein (TIGR02996 family)
MIDRDAFLRTILDHPEDDLARLVYADWLDEHGEQARADLIRVQCELEKLTDEDPRGVVLCEREAELLTAHAHSWRFASSCRRGRRSWRRVGCTVCPRSLAFVSNCKPPLLNHETPWGGIPGSALSIRWTSSHSPRSAGLSAQVQSGQMLLR